MIAEVLLGRGERAYDYYRRLAPAFIEELEEIHCAEPYVYAQMIAGPDAAHCGQAKNSWLTGTAAWNYVAICHYMLGIRPEHHGLRVAPTIVREIGSYRVTRRCRGAEYVISVRCATDGLKPGLYMDGRRLPSDIVPYAEPGARVSVECIAHGC
jgi:cellobiose phosphorylase